MKRYVDHVKRVVASPRGLVLVLVGVALLWASWPSLRDMAGQWSVDPRYSHGFLVPLFALYLLWLRRERLESVRWDGAWWGLGLIAVGEGLRLAGTGVYVKWVAAVGLLPSLAGLVVLAGGRPALRWAWPAIAFLVFMIPLPYRVEAAVGQPLQNLATKASNYALQTLGLPAVAEGNVILIDDARIGVVDACNGLGMMFMFLAFATAAVLVLRSSWIEKVVILLSAVPIAVAANVARITLTGWLQVAVGKGVADSVYHDLAGWLMMPLALLTLWAETFILSHLVIEEDDARPAAPPVLFVPPKRGGQAVGGGA